MKTYEQLKKENFIIIDNDFFTKKYLKDYGMDSILILSLIQKNLLVRGRYIFNLQYLFDCLGIKKNNSLQQNKIKDILINLQEGNIINSDLDLVDINNNQLVYVDINIPKDNYTIVYDFEVDAVINYKQENLYNLFSTFVFLKYRIGTRKYCYWNQSDIAKSIGLKSRKTVSKYVDVLAEELQLIKYINVGNRLFKDGSVKQSNNTYVLNYEDADEILESARLTYEEELKEKNIQLVKSKNADEKRSVKQRINYLRNKYYQENITDVEIKELKKLEKEYYHLNKHNQEKIEAELEKFILFEPVQEHSKIVKVFNPNSIKKSIPKENIESDKDDYWNWDLDLDEDEDDLF